MFKKFLEWLKGIFSHRSTPVVVAAETRRVEEIPEVRNQSVGPNPVSSVYVVDPKPMMNPAPESLPNKAAFDQMVASTSFAVWLDGQKVRPGFGPELIYATTADGSIVRGATPPQVQPAATDPRDTPPPTQAPVVTSGRADRVQLPRPRDPGYKAWAASVVARWNTLHSDAERAAYITGYNGSSRAQPLLAAGLLNSNQINALYENYKSVGWSDTKDNGWQSLDGQTLTWFSPDFRGVNIYGTKIV